MKFPIRFWGCTLALSFYLIACYPKKEIIAHWPNGRVKVVRHHKRNSKWNERLVGYYDNGKKQYIHYWKDEYSEMYKVKAWYKSGAKLLVGWRKYKDTSTTYYPEDSVHIFKGLCKEYVKEWYENGKGKFEPIMKGNLLLCNYYDEDGKRIRQDLEILRPDGYDTAITKTLMGHKGTLISPQLRRDYLGSMFDDGE